MIRRRDFLRIRDCVFQLQRRRIGTRRILEAENAVVLDFIQKDNVCSKSASVSPGKPTIMSDVILIPAWPLHPGDALHILLAGVEALHGIEHAVGTALHRQVHVIAQGRNPIDGFHDVTPEIPGMRSGEAHSPHAGSSAAFALRIQVASVSASFKQGITIETSGTSQRSERVEYWQRLMACALTPVPAHSRSVLTTLGVFDIAARQGTGTSLCKTCASQPICDSTRFPGCFGGLATAASGCLVRSKRKLCPEPDSRQTSIAMFLRDRNVLRANVRSDFTTLLPGARRS